MTAFRSAPSLDEVDREVLAMRASGAAPDAKSIGVGFLFLAVGLLVGGLASGKLLFAWVGISLIVPAAALLLLSFQESVRIRRTAREGCVGRGTILSAKSNVKERSVVFVLEVTVEGYDQFYAEAPAGIDPVEAARLVGQESPILWHPKWPTQVLIASLPEPVAPRLGPQPSGQPPRR